MATLNHTNLTTYNVPGLKDFFRSVFDFQVLDERAASSPCCGIRRAFC